LCVGVVSADGVDDVDAVFEELLGGHFEWGVSFFDKSTSDAVFDVRELCSGVWR
jgi:hypothetical protein